MPDQLNFSLVTRQPVEKRALAGEVFEDDGWRFGPLLDSYIETLNDVPNERRVGVYHPSSLAMCARKMYYGRVGHQPKRSIPPKLRKIFDTGHAVHEQIGDYVKGMMARGDAGLGEEIDVQIEGTVEHGETGIYGHADLIVHSHNRVIDIKTISRDRFSRLRPPTILPSGEIKPADMTGYIWQVHAYMACLNMTQGTLFYWCKDNSDWLEFSFTFRAAVWARIKEKLDGIEDCLVSGEPPAREISKYYCPGCEYYDLCKPPGVTKRRGRR